MKGINTPGQALERGGVASFSAPRGGYLTLLSRHSLGNGTMVMLVLLSLRWGIKRAIDFGRLQQAKEALMCISCSKKMQRAFIFFTNPTKV
ncbi:MAG: hypothetical protein WBI82_00635 [Sphaerochaeta sp.]